MGQFPQVLCVQEALHIYRTLPSSCFEAAVSVHQPHHLPQLEPALLQFLCLPFMFCFYVSEERGHRDVSGSFQLRAVSASVTGCKGIKSVHGGQIQRGSTCAQCMIHSCRVRLVQSYEGHLMPLQKKGRESPQQHLLLQPQSQPASRMHQAGGLAPEEVIHSQHIAASVQGKALSTTFLPADWTWKQRPLFSPHPPLSSDTLDTPTRPANQSTHKSQRH